MSPRRPNAPICRENTTSKLTSFDQYGQHRDVVGQPQRRPRLRRSRRVQERVNDLLRAGNCCLLQKVQVGHPLVTMDLDHEPAPRPGIELPQAPDAPAASQGLGHCKRAAQVGNGGLQSRTGLAVRPGTAVDPTCSTGTTSQGPPAGGRPWSATIPV